MENLKEKTAKGLFWGAMSNGMMQVLNLLIGIFLARLLSPAEYGVVGVLTIFTAVAGAIQSGGFGTGLINIKHPTENDYNSVFWVNTSISVVLYFLLFLSAPLIATYFKQPCLVSVSRVVFLILPLSAIALVSGTYLTKNMMNREIAIISVVALICAGITGISLAYMGCSYWSLVWQQLVYVIVSDVGRFYFAPWRPSMHIDVTPVKKLFSFSVKLMLTSIINTFNQHMLTFIFGRLFSIGAVGNYSQANKWNSMAHSTITSSIGQVAQTVFVTASNENERELRVFRKMMRFTAFFSFPIMLGLALVSREFILNTIGEKWVDCIPLLQILCVGGAFLPLHTIYQNFIISHGRSDLYLRIVILQILLQIGIVLTLSSQGITMMVAAFSILNIVFTVFWHYAMRYVHPMAAKDVLKDTAPFAMIAATVMLVTYYVTLSITNLWLLLLARIVVAVVLYYIIMRLLNVAILNECLNLIRKKDNGNINNHSRL